MGKRPQNCKRTRTKMATQEGVIDLSSVIYDVDPVVMVPLGLLILVLTASLPKSHRLSLRDSLVAFWYLFNGIIIHIFLDGLVGFARRVPFLFSLYCTLDKRYEHAESAVMMISITELLIMGPLCIFLYYRNRSWRAPLELVVCAIQIFGTIVFTGSEIWEGFPHIPTDFEMTFEQDKVIFFWVFFVAANALWLLLPLRLLLTAFHEVNAAMLATRPAAKGSSSKAKKSTKKATSKKAD